MPSIVIMMILLNHPFLLLVRLTTWSPLSANKNKRVIMPSVVMILINHAFLSDKYLAMLFNWHFVRHYLCNYQIRTYKEAQLNLGWIKSKMERAAFAQCAILQGELPLASIKVKQRKNIFLAIYILLFHLLLLQFPLFLPLLSLLFYL